MAAKTTLKASPKLPKRGNGKLPIRKKAAGDTDEPQGQEKPERKGRRKIAPPLPKMKFTKRSIAALPFHVIPDLKLPKRGNGKLPIRKKAAGDTDECKKPHRWTAPPKYYVRVDTETPNLCVRVTPTTKTFFWQKTVNRKQKRINIGRFPAINPEQARAKANDIAADYVKGTDVQEELRLKLNEKTFGDLWKDYRENRPRRTPQQKKDGEYSVTLDNQWRLIFANEEPKAELVRREKYGEWKNKQLSEITYEKVSKLIRPMRKRAPIYANRIQRHGQAMFNFAKRSRDWRWKGENPFEFDFESEEGRAREERLRPKDIGAFMEGLDACSETMKLIFLASLYTGRRIREVRAMRWADLDLEIGIWHLPKTKRGKRQDAMLPKVLIKIFTQLKEKRDINVPWVFPGDSEEGHVTEYKKAWEQVRAVSGLHKLQPRDLRRTMASWAQDGNVSIAVMQAQLGHASPVTTAKHYTKILEEVQRAAVDSTVASMIAAATAKEADEQTESPALS